MGKVIEQLPPDERKTFGPERMMRAAQERLWVGSFSQLLEMELPERKVTGRFGNVPVGSGERVLVWGPPGSKKTLLTYKTTAEAVIKGQKALIFQAEGSLASVRDRLKMLGNGIRPEGIADAGDRLFIVHAGFDITRLPELYSELIERFDPDMVVVDTLRDHTSASENDAAETSMFLQSLKHPMRPEATLILVHHSTKPDERGRVRERGSSAAVGWADSVISVIPESNEKGAPVVCKHEKSRDTERSESVKLHWHFSPDSIRVEMEDHVEGQPKLPTGHELVRMARNGKVTKKSLRKQTGLAGETLDEWIGQFVDAGLLKGIESIYTDAETQRQFPYIQYVPGPNA